MNQIAVEMIMATDEGKFLQENMPEKGNAEFS